jgi:hypothetical protein
MKFKFGNCSKTIETTLKKGKKLLSLKEKNMYIFTN